jgi:hypothetical protein
MRERAIAFLLCAEVSENAHQRGNGSSSISLGPY